MQASTEGDIRETAASKQDKELDTENSQNDNITSGPLHCYDWMIIWKNAAVLTIFIIVQFFLFESNIKFER